jgi:hypothetical protein
VLAALPAVAEVKGLSASNVPPPPAGVDVFNLTAGAEDLSPGGNGGGAGGLWARTWRHGVSSELGASWASLDGVRWHYGRIGASLRRTRTLFQAAAELGRGRRPGVEFPYRIYTAGVVANILPGRLFFELSDRYLYVDEARGHLVKVGLSASPRAYIRAELASHFSVTGNLGARYASARLDLLRGRAGGLAGLNVGRSRPEVLRRLVPGAVVSATELYAGIRGSAGPHELTLIVDSLWTAGVRRHAFTASWTVRPRGRASSPAPPPGSAIQPVS